MTDATTLPDDPAALKAIIAVMADRNARLEKLETRINPREIW